MPDPTLKERPNSVPWPPILFAAGALAAVAAGWAAPMGGIEPMFLRFLGLLVIAAGVGLDLWAMQTMRQGAANIMPHKAATALITRGPFALSRNPIYLGNTLALFGAAGALANPWFIPAALITAVLIQRMAIRREEAHLAILFGPAWTAYARRVPRWLALHRRADAVRDAG